jgi:hypothetical protein
VAWAIAFLTSWRSTLLTMSNELSAMGGSLLWSGGSRRTRETPKVK